MKFKRMCLAYVLLMLVSTANAGGSNSEFYCDTKSEPKKVFNLIVEPNLVKNTSVSLIKYNCSTGETWVKNEKDWVRVSDASHLPISSYIIKQTETRDGTLSLFRMDQSTGNTWIAVGNQWKPL